MDDNDAAAPRAKSKPRPEAKRTRRNYEGELVCLQGRVDLAVKVLRKNAPSELISLALEILEGI